MPQQMAAFPMGHERGGAVSAPPPLNVGSPCAEPRQLKHGYRWAEHEREGQASSRGPSPQPPPSSRAQSATPPRNNARTRGYETQRPVLLVFCTRITAC